MTVKQFEAEVKQFEYRCWCQTLVLFVTARHRFNRCHSLLLSCYIHHHCLHGMEIKDMRNILWLSGHFTIIGWAVATVYNVVHHRENKVL